MLPALGVLTDEDIAAIDFAADGELIAKLVVELMEVVSSIDADLSTINNLMAYFTNGMDMDKILYLAEVLTTKEYDITAHELLDLTIKIIAPTITTIINSILTIFKLFFI